MSLSIADSRLFSNALKTARKKQHLTQEKCAELLNISVSFLKDLERSRSTPSLSAFYNICRVLNISADECIFHEVRQENSQSHQELLRLLSFCNESSLSVLTVTAQALIENQTKDLSNT